LTRRRGFIYDVYFPDLPGEQKPALVVSSDAVNRGKGPIVAQVTTTERVRMLPTYVVLEPGEGGIERRSYVLCHELVTLDEDQVAEDPWGPMIPLTKFVEVERALMATFDTPFEE
jgi:mRNA-degrading endonuclease toxin of MazEF toxin-antitoxin module